MFFCSDGFPKNVVLPSGGFFEGNMLEVYPRSLQISKMEPFSKVAIVTNSSISDVGKDSESNFAFYFK